MYYDAGDHQLAMTHYEVALRMADTFPEVAYNLALTYLCLNDRERAIQTLLKYIEMTDPADHEQARKLIQLLKL